VKDYRKIALLSIKKCIHPKGGFYDKD